ncbi:MAG: tyrosine--tRNA ligase [Patescibacteria group bacterium]
MDKIDEILTRGVVNIIPGKKELEIVLNSGKKLNVYLGIDPTATKIHLGNAVALRKLQQLVGLGHNVTFLIGDATALIGDTSDKDNERPVLTPEEIKENFKNYKNQASKILDFSKVTIKFNSEWLNKLSFTDTIKLAQNFSFGDFASRELVKKRLADKKRVGLHEALYPAMQGYDSYFLDTDIQIGGADQTFNMQAGRILQKNLRGKESFIIVTGYLEGTDGRKMSKSWGNAIWLNDRPEEIFGKILSIRDDLVETYLTLATNLQADEISKIKSLQPLETKKQLAFYIVKELHSEKEAKSAQGNFEKTFQDKKPEFETEVPVKNTLAETIAPFTSLASISDAKRLIKNGGVDISGETIYDPNYRPRVGELIKVGKRLFGKIK